MARERVHEEILKDLNAEQREAVTATEGPVLIVAGAGTGKTKVITNRVAYLLSSKKNLGPENILALTFTDKATDEMQERIEKAVGDSAHDIWVATFHAFARKILAENGSHIGIPANFKILNDVEKWIILKKLLPDLRLDYYLQLADPAAVLKSFVNFISRAKDELILPGEYEAYAKGLRRDFQKKRKGLSEEERLAVELEVKREEEVARIYSTYQKRSLEENALDFGDLIIYTIRLFNERPNILSQYQDQFKYIVVDEFQDTNVAQIELLRMLSRKNKNICVVGDDDQAIYRFRGASYASFLKFKENFPGLKTIKLTQNYRSTERILKTADSLILNNGVDRYDPKKNLWTEKPKGPAVKAIVAHDYRDEARAVADEIEALYAGLKGEEKRYSNIAVLYRAHLHKNTLLEELKMRGVPAAVVRGVGLFQTEEIRDLMAFLNVIQDPTDSVSLFRIFTSPVWNIDVEDLITITNHAAREECPIYDIIKEPQKIKNIGKATKGKLKKFRTQIKDLMRVSKRENASESFIGILEKTGYLSRLLKKDKKTRQIDSDQKALNIGKFFRFITSYLKNNTDQSLSGFMQYLNFFIEGGGDPGQEDLILDEDAVQFMTIHSAKGLEFPYVFLISMVQRRFPTPKRKEPIPFPVSLMKEKLPQGDFHKEEERRLCYVAMTRAQERLTLSGIDKPNNRLSMFLKEVLTEGSLESQNIAWADIQPSSEVEDRIGSVLLDRIARIGAERGVSYKLPRPNKLSYTQLDMYNKCPLQYKFSYIYRIPTRRRNALTFGSNVHSTLEDFFTLIQQGKPVSEKALFDLFDKHWDSFGYTSRMDESNYKKSGAKALKVFYEKHKSIFGRPPLFLEKKIDLRVGDFMLDVRIDRIDDLGKGKVEIIDYKTGRPKDDDFVSSSLQLSIYALACKEVLKLEPSLVSFYYVNPNKKVTTTRTAEDYENTKKTIVEAGSRILAEEFEPTPGRFCGWCDYKTVCPVWDKR
ncbi:ATP-dependent helicase [Omnitrophica bacterium]|nr:ATP-dependent helicase [Candidatus Omnitrophota bacterium]